MVDRRHVWVKRIPNMDGVVRALVFGKLCYPRVDWRVVPLSKPNHKSWEQPGVKAILGLKSEDGHMAIPRRARVDRPSTSGSIHHRAHRVRAKEGA